jgi:hypothetical protein
MRITTAVAANGLGYNKHLKYKQTAQTTTNTLKQNNPSKIEGFLFF